VSVPRVHVGGGREWKRDPAYLFTTQDAARAWVRAPHVLSFSPDSPHFTYVHALEGCVEAGVGSLHALERI
jgi:hypothetical protein